MSKLDEIEDRYLIEKAIRQRIEGIKLKRPDLIREMVDVTFYSKFDDWPPGFLMLGEDALKSEEAALEVLDEYQYVISKMEVRIKEETAWASFYLHYNGIIRKRRFNSESRVSVILVKSETRLQWKIVHEHFSTTPILAPNLGLKSHLQETREKETEKIGATDEQGDDFEEVIIGILGDGVERSTAEIIREVSKLMGVEVPSSKIIQSCQKLVSRGIVESRGRFYPKYRIKTTKPTPT